MKPTQSLLLATALITATGAILFSSFHPKKTESAPAPVTTSMGESHPAGSTTSTVPAASIRRAEASSNKSSATPASIAAPSGISSAKWQQATALTGMIGTFAGSDAAAIGSSINATDSVNLLEALGIAPGAANSVSGLIAQRNEATRQATADLLQQITHDPRDFTELIALSLMAQESPLSAGQQSRLDQLEHDQEQAVKAAGPDLSPWFEDDAFLTSMREKLDPETATRLDDYAADQKRMSNEKTAFDNSQTLAKKLGLDGDQRQQLFEAYRQNPTAGDDQILPILDDAQKAAYQANKTAKPDVSISIQPGKK